VLKPVYAPIEGDSGMRQNSAFTAKIIYVSACALLLFPLYFLGTPATITPEGKIVGGGVLSQKRQEYKLAESHLGEVDPASEVIQLATLGLRGVATNILWGRAIDFKMKEDWDSFQVTLDQIAKLQPHFFSVWQFQSWNLAYNVSVEFDDYHHRYQWVKKGIDYLVKGTQYNLTEPRLFWEIGWIFGQKMGGADEKTQFRRLFREDDDYHDTIPLANREEARSDIYGKYDNWLMGRLWYLKSQHIVDNLGVPLIGRNPLVFHASPAGALIHYADAAEDEGNFGDRVQFAWSRAGKEWRKFGSRDIRVREKIMVRLDDYEVIVEQREQLKKQIDELTLNKRELMQAEREKMLTDEERAARDVEAQLRTDEQRALAHQAEDKIAVSYAEVANSVPASIRLEARRLARQYIDRMTFAKNILRYREIVNYQFWRTRCDVEQTKEAVQGRELLFDAGQLLDSGKAKESREKYEEAWLLWAGIYEKFPALLNDIVTADGLLKHILRYRNETLSQLDEEMPDDFPLQDILDAYGRQIEAVEEPEVDDPEEAEKTDAA